MRVVDTSAWVETLKQSDIGQRIAPEIPDRGDWLVPTIVQFELARWAKRELNVRAARRVLAFAQTCNIADLTSELAMSAAERAARHRLSAADAIIYATAQAFGADLLTCNAHFQDLPGVRYVPKSH